MSTKNRQSNMELLRIFSMLCIVVYHIFLFGLDAHHPEEPLYKSLQIPFHVGVPIFVMISGYFGIRFSLRGLFRRIYLCHSNRIAVGSVFLSPFGFSHKKHVCHRHRSSLVSDHIPLALSSFTDIQPVFHRP